MLPNRPFWPGKGQPTRIRWVIFFLICAVSWLLYVHRYSWGVIKPIFHQENPHFTDTDLGWLDSAFFAAYGLGQVPGGLLGDIFGPRWILTGSVLFWSALAAGVVWTAGFWQVLAIRAAFGLAQAPAYPVVSKMTRSWFPLSIRTSVQGVVTALGRIGAACAPLLLATVLMGLLGFSWQEALLALTGLGAVLALALWFLVRSTPREHPLCNAAEQELISAGTAPATSGKRTALLGDPASLLSLSMLLLYAFASTFQDQLYVNWIPKFLMEGRGLTATEMGLFAPLPFIGGAIGGILGGIFNDVLIRAWKNRRWARCAVAFTGKFVASGLVLLAVRMEDGRLAMVMLLAARVFGDWSLPTQWGAITDMSGRASATVFGLVNTVGAVGAFVAGPILGHLKQYYHWEGLFLGVAGMCLLSALTWFLIDCNRKLVAE